MQIIKPNWVTHEDDKGNPQTIYSLHVHPDGTRLATGSIQNVVKIWSTAPILDSASEASGEDKVPRLLCRMEGHDGAVLCVRWTHNGMFLATGSDDSIIMVWLRCPGQSKSFGSKAANVEDWKPFKRLAGHTSDVCDLAWSDDDQYLASVGLDNLVLIWDCQDSAFLLLRRLDLHQGHVNGVAWDPVGQYLATQADDRTVKIWRTADWKIEADITAPFKDAPRSFFRRLSWSPDGAHIVTPNAMNGPVFVSAVIERAAWTSDISLVGHENVVEVVAHNPHMFLKDNKLPADGYNICAALALGARNSISIWLTNSSTPVVVLHDVFDRDILDISWAADGVTLYACSSEGRVAAFVIQELRSIITMAPPETRTEFHKTYSFKKPDRRQQARSASITNAPKYRSPLSSVEPYRPTSSPYHPSQHIEQSLEVGSTANVLTQQEMTIMPNGKRRIRPVFLGTNESTMFSVPQINGHAIPHTSAQYDRSPEPVVPVSQVRRSDEIVTSNTINSLSSIPKMPTFLAEEFSTPSVHKYGMGDLIHWENEDSWGREISTPSESVSIIGSGEEELKLSCRNGGESIEGPCSQVKLLTTANGRSVWEAKLLGRVITSSSLSFSHSAIGCSDGTLLVFSRSGRRTLPMVVLDSSCYLLQLRDQMLMAITAKGTLIIWDLKSYRALGSSIQLSDLNPSRRFIAFSALTSAGLPIIGSRKGSVYTYDRNLLSWTMLVDPLDSSDVPGSPGALESLAHVDGTESALSAAMVLSSKSDLETCLVNYALKLVNQRSFSKVEELCKELWTGCSGIFGVGSGNSHGKLDITRNDRLRLLHKIINILSTPPRPKTQPPDPQSTFDPYVKNIQFSYDTLNHFKGPFLSRREKSPSAPKLHFCLSYQPHSISEMGPQCFCFRVRQ